MDWFELSQWTTLGWVLCLGASALFLVVGAIVLIKTDSLSALRRIPDRLTRHRSTEADRTPAERHPSMIRRDRRRARFIKRRNALATPIKGGRYRG